MPDSKLYKNLILIGLIFHFVSLSGQQEEGNLSLEDALTVANQRSLDAFKAKRRYAVEYWRFRSFKARLLPKIDLDLEPFTYNRAFVERYDPDRNIDVFRLQQNLNTYARVSVSQNIMFTGASVFVSSSFDRLVNYGANALENYNITPVRIGLIQPIMAFNALKWQKKTASLELEKAKKEFIYDQQQINLKTVALFFRWALASVQVDIVRENRETAQRLFDIGRKRYDLGSIGKDELLNLELESFTTNTNLTQAEQELDAVTSDLKLFLDLEDISAYDPELPQMIPELKIRMERARELAERHNPELMEAEIQEINADRDLDRAIKENRFDLSVNASYGLNQQANELPEAYRNFLDQQIVAIRFSMPLLDWGERKGNIKMARMTRELADIEIEQSQNDVARQLLLAVNNFNLQEEQVNTALRARNIARESYQITEKRFLSGQVDLLRLTSARSAWQTATEQYVQNLHRYWEYYYQVQQLTLYDFMDDTTLSENFDELLEEG